MSASVPSSPQASPGVPYQRHAEAADDAERAPVYAIAPGVPHKALAVPECQQAEAGGWRTDSGRPRSGAYNDTSEGRERNGEARRDIELVPPSRAKWANRSLAKPANLAEVFEMLGRVETLTLRQHHDMRSALKCVARVVGRPLYDISTDIGALRALFADAAPANGRVSVGRWTRVRSVSLAALQMVGVPVMPGRMPNGLSPAWQDLFERLPDRGSRHGLSRLLKFCTQQGIEPEHFNLDTFSLFDAAVTKTSLRLGNKETRNVAARLWNTAVASVPGWPAVTAPIKPDTRKYSVPRDSFPASFHEDVERFLANAGNPNPFSKDYAQPVRSSTLEVRRRIVMQLASALAHSGKPSTEIIGLATLVEPMNAEASLQYLSDRLAGRETTHIGAQANLLVMVARHWVKADLECISQLSGFAKNLTSKRPQEMTERNRTRLRQFDLPSNLKNLYSLGTKIRKEVEAHDDGTHRTSLRVMFALAVEFLCFVPMRINDLCGLQPARHIIEAGHGVERIRFIRIAARETAKKGPAIEGQLGSSTIKLLDLYCSTHRERVCASSGDFLFPGRSGGKRAVTTFSSDLSAFIYRELGLKMHSHLFRHLYAKVTLDHDPNDIESVRQGLRHQSSTTTLRHYAELRMDAAMKRHEQLVNSLREDPPGAGRTQAGRSHKSTFSKGKK